MKNLVEVMFKFSNVGAKTIDENRKKLNEMAQEIEKTANSANDFVESQEKMEDALKDTTKAQKDATKEAKKAGDQNKKLSNDSSSNLDKSLKSIKGVSVGLAAVASAATLAIAAFAKSAADEFAENKIVADTNGLDFRELQAYKTTLDQLNIGVDQFGDKLRDIGERFTEAFTEGTGEGLDVLKTLRVSDADIKSLAEAAPLQKFERIYELTKDLNQQQKLQIFNKLGIDELNIVFTRMDDIRKKREELFKSGLFVTDEEASRLKEFDNTWTSFTNNLQTFSTIIYSGLIPAFKDLFVGNAEGFDLTREGANDVLESLVEILKFFSKMKAVGGLAIDMISAKFTDMGIYASQAGQFLKYLFDTMNNSLSGIIIKLKAVDIGVAIADLSKKTFSGIIDVVFAALEKITSGIASVANSISKVLPQSVIDSLNSAQESIKNSRDKYFKYEQSAEQKNNLAKIKAIDEETDARQEAIDEQFKLTRINNKKLLDENEKTYKKDLQNFGTEYERVSNIDAKKFSISTSKANEKKTETAKVELKKMIDDTEVRSKLIDKLVAEAEAIQNKIKLKIANPQGQQYTTADVLAKYSEAIDVAAKDTKLINKELDLRLKKVDIVKEMNDKSMQDIRDNIENLKLISELEPAKFGQSKQKIIDGYNQLITLAKSQGATELQINQIISERKQYLDDYASKQEAINSKLREMETSLLEAQNKNSEVRKRNREDELKATQELFKNATEEQKNSANSMINALFDINDAKARIAELNTEIDKLVDARDNKTDVFDRTKLLELETQINTKIAERNGLEDQLGMKRQEAQEKYIISLSQVKDLLNTTYTNLSTLVTSTLTGVESLSDAVKNFFNSTLQSLAQLLQQLIVMRVMGLLGSSFGFTSGAGIFATGTSTASMPAFKNGGYVSASKSGNGVFNAMGSLKKDEINAILHDKEAVLTPENQKNLGNNISDLMNSSGSSVQNNINVNIDNNSLAKSIGSTSEFKEAVQLAVKSDRASYKQIINS